MTAISNFPQGVFQCIHDLLLRDAVMTPMQVCCNLVVCCNRLSSAIQRHHDYIVRVCRCISKRMH